jgi:DnaK suppressor protein
MAKKVTLAKRDRERIKKKLLQRKAEILNDLYGSKTEIDKFQDPKADDLDRAVEAGAMELLVALGDSERRELEEILVALDKLESGTYGKCEACLDEPLHLCSTCPNIPKQRLDALPTARLCVACQEAEEKNQIPSYTRLRPRRMIFSEDMEEFTHPLMDSNDDD